MLEPHGPPRVGASTVLSIAPHVDLSVVDERGLVVTTHAGQEVFSGAEYASVARAVDGIRTEAELFEAVAADGAAEAIEVLRAAGVLVEADDTLPARSAAFWGADGLAPRRVAERFAAASVAVEVVGEADGSEVRELLRDAGVTVADEAGLTLVLVDDYLRVELSERNERALATGRPWMLASTPHVETWLGPVFVPNRGPCWECLAQRLRLHRSLDVHLHQMGTRSTPPDRGRGALASTRQAVAGMIATAVLRWILLESASGLSETVLSVDTRLWQTRSHALGWRPQCPACGEPRPPETVAARPVDLAGPGERPAPAGSLRTVTPDATLERFSDQVSPITGVVNRVARSASARPPLHAYVAAAPEPKVHGDDRSWLPHPTTPPGGKGPTDEQARASALCEALERYSSRFGGEEPWLTASYDDLGDRAVHPNAVMGFSQDQYRSRETTNAAAQSMRTFVPEPFDPTAEIEWTPVWSLSQERERLLPTAFCYYEVPGAIDDGCLADSNGNAAGNTIEEAILHGFLELVERDHVALWWYNRLRLPGLDIGSFSDPWLEQVRARFAQDDRELWALDLTADLGIPAAVAVAAPPGDRDGALSFGFGAHLDLGLALQRATAELVQLSTGVASAGLGHGPRDQLRAGDASYLRPDSEAPARAAADSAMASSGDLRLDIDMCRGLVEDRGMEMMVLDQTRADIGLPVVKVVIPGMRHFWPRFGPGRLYDVPVALGQLAAPLAESELNPVPPTA
jgi:ribosomal protein S12 methylthiotransferase accessory factor